MGDYDIFQRFPDGSSLWQLCVSGRYNTERKLQELTEASGNEFYAVDLSCGERISTHHTPTNSAAARQTKTPNTNAA